MNKKFSVIFGLAIAFVLSLTISMQPTLISNGNHSASTSMGLVVSSGKIA